MQAYSVRRWEKKVIKNGNMFQEDDHRNSVHHDDNNHHGNHSDAVKSNAVPHKTREPVVVQPTSEQLMIAQVGAYS